MNITFILLSILSVARLWIAVQLFLSAQKFKLTNLYWLAALFGLATVYSVFTPVSPSNGNPWVFHLGFITGHFCLAMFIHKTFYRGRKSPISIIAGLVVIAFLGDIFALATNNTNLAGLISSVGLVTWTWHLVTAQQAYRNIAIDPSVEGWVKSRYKLMIAYVVIIMFSTLQVTLASSNLGAQLPPILTIMGILFVLGSIVLQFLVWIMPEPFRLWLNRNQQAHSEELRQAQAELIITMLISSMAEFAGQNNKIILGHAIRTSVGKIIGTDESEEVKKHIVDMGYKEWDTLLQRQDFRHLITSSGVKNVEKAIDNARKTLIEKQSLFTMKTK